MADEHEVPKPDVNYPGRSHEELKTWTDTGEPGDAETLADAWKKMGNGLTEAAENLMVAVFGSESGWTGVAADAMRSRLQKVAEWSQKTGDSFNKASDAFVSQGESVGTAKTAMPEPVQYDPSKMIKDAATSGNIVQMAMLPYNMHKQAEAKREAHEAAIRVVSQRDAQLAAAAQSIPPFEPPPTMAADKPKEPGPGAPGMPGAPGIRPGAGSAAGRGGGAGGSAGPGLPGANFPGGPNGGAGVNGPDGANNNEDQNQPPPNISVPSMPIGPGGNTGISGYSSSLPNQFTGPGPGGGGLPTGAGPAGGGGGFGGAFGGGFGPGGAPRPGGGFGPMGPGAAGGAAPPAGPMGPGGAGRGPAGGRGGAPGAGGMGAGRGQGGEDEEHQRPSYLVEPDPDATFGSDQLTAPPVIGG
jgi:hypothetical protein